MNNSHRGLPPPVGMSLPPPNERPASNIQSLGHLPAPPTQWTGADESMRQWLQAKAEEDRRRQEEERTKQETLRLDQRKVEQDMLRESLQGGVPPPMVPLIFAGIGGGNLPSHTLEWAQQYLASLSIQNQQQQQQLQAQQQQMQQLQHQQPSPEIQRDHRNIPANPYGQQSIQNAVSQQSQQGRGIIMAPQPSSNLSRLNTVDLQPVPTQPQRQQIQPAQPPQPEANSGPGLFFHHWTPPANHQPPTPSGKSNQGSPFSQHAGSHLRSEYQNTPKKRKTAGSNPMGPTSQPNDPSPPYSRSSRERESSPRPRSKSGTRRHSRQRSDTSSRDMDSRPIARPSSRQQRHDEMTGANHYDSRRQMNHNSGDDHHNQIRWDGPKSETR